MINKQNILDNVEFYSTDQLVDYIQQGIVSYEELVSETDGDFDANKRKEVKKKLESGDSDAWKYAKNTNTVEAIQIYLDAYPNGQFRNEARALKQQLLEAAQKKEAESSTSNPQLPSRNDIELKEKRVDAEKDDQSGGNRHKGA